MKSFSITKLEERIAPVANPSVAGGIFFLPCPPGFEQAVANNTPLVVAELDCGCLMCNENANFRSTVACAVC